MHIVVSRGDARGGLMIAVAYEVSPVVLKCPHCIWERTAWGRDAGPVLEIVLRAHLAIFHSHETKRSAVT